MIWKDRQQSRQQQLILPSVKDKNYNSLAGELAIILSVYALKGFSVWKKKLACKAGNPLALTCTRIKTTYDQLARQKHGSSKHDSSGISALCCRDTMSPKGISCIPSRPHFSREHIVMVMTLSEEVHSHLSTSLIIPFLLPPSQKKKKNHSICSIRRDRFLCLIPHFPPAAFPPWEGSGAARMRRDITEQVWSNLSLKGARGFVSSQWHPFQPVAI